MPPKKKSDSKVIKQESLPLFSEPPPPSQRIPRKPLFRHVEYSNIRRARHIKVKCWKVLSSKLSNFYDHWSLQFLDPFSMLGQTVLGSLDPFMSTIKHSTIKKSHKFIKRFQIDLDLFGKPQFIRQLCFPWKLEKLNLRLYPNTKPDSTLKAFLNSKLKTCYLNYKFKQTFWEPNPKFISSFRRLRKSDLLVNSNVNDLRMLINTDKLRLLSNKLQKADTDPSNRFIRDQVLINAPECFKKISYKCNDNPDRGFNIIPDLPPLPNLEELHFSWNAHYRGDRIVDISFVQQFQQLKSLSICLDHRESETLDFLENLPHLKEFCFSSRQSTIRELPPRKLPNLTKLEKIGFCLTEPSLIKMKDVRDFILNNKRLSYLDLSLSIQDFATVFEENEDNEFVIPCLEKLKLDLNSIERPYAGAAKKIVKILKQHSLLKELTLEIQQSNADLNVILLKDGLAHLKSLQHLGLKFSVTGGLEENKFKHLKDAFANLGNLASLDLDLNSDSLGPRDIVPILDGLEKLQRVETIRFQAKFIKLTPATEKKFGRYIASLRHLKGLNLSLRGLSDETKQDMRENLLPKFALFDDTFSLL